MTDREGAVYDLGYTPYEGERRGRMGARRTIFFDGVRRVLGIRRKARKKILPWILVGIAALPAIVFVGLAFFVPGEVVDGTGGPLAHAEFFGIGGTIVLIFTALAAPELLIPDRKDGVLSMLSSRPLTSGDYIATRFASLVAIVLGFLLIPQFLLYIGQASTHDDGLFAGMVDSADVLPRILVVAGIYTLAYVPLGFVVASLAQRKAIASSIYLAGMIALTLFAEAIVRNSNFAGGRWFALAAPINTADAANFWVFGQTNEGALLDFANIHPSIGLLALVVVAVAATGFSVVRYRSLL